MAFSVLPLLVAQASLALPAVVAAEGFSVLLAAVAGFSVPPQRPAVPSVREQPIPPAQAPVQAASSAPLAPAASSAAAPHPAVPFLALAARLMLGKQRKVGRAPEDSSGAAEAPSLAQRRQPALVADFSVHLLAEEEEEAFSDRRPAEPASSEGLLAKGRLLLLQAALSLSLVGLAEHLLPGTPHLRPRGFLERRQAEEEEEEEASSGALVAGLVLLLRLPQEALASLQPSANPHPQLGAYLEHHKRHRPSARALAPSSVHSLQEERLLGSQRVEHLDNQLGSPAQAPLEELQEGPALEQAASDSPLDLVVLAAAALEPHRAAWAAAATSSHSSKQHSKLLLLGGALFEPSGGHGREEKQNLSHSARWGRTYITGGPMASRSEGRRPRTTV